VTRLRKWMEGRGLWDDAREKELRSGTRKSVLRAFEEAEKMKKPGIGNAFTDVWEHVTEEQKAHMTEMADILQRYPKEYDLDGHEGGARGLSDQLADLQQKK
jgi:2-oxoisovalerate dehydrogenase E1 component alpha subunit